MRHDKCKGGNKRRRESIFVSICVETMCYRAWHTIFHWNNYLIAAFFSSAVATHGHSASIARKQAEAGGPIDPGMLSLFAVPSASLFF